MQELVICAIGPDRTGIVDELTGLLHEHGANVGQSRMVNLAGQFALLLAAQTPVEQVDTLAQAVHDRARALGMSVTIARPEPAVRAPKAGQAMRLRVSAMDQPGIVHRVTHLLHQCGANIEDLTTDLEAGSYTGTPLFRMELAMTLPAKAPVRELRRQLAELCDALNCDYDLHAA